MLFYNAGKRKKKMKNYLLSFFYSLLYLSITLTGFWGLSTILDPQTYKIVFMTSLSLGVCLSLFLSIWFRQDDLLFLLFLTLITYVFLEISNAVLTDEISYYRLVAFPLICLL